MHNNLPYHIISKSTYQRGLQCVKNLYLNKHHPELRDELSDKTKEIFETGHDVGKYAQQLFPGGIDCGFEITNSGKKSVELTEQAIKDGTKVIYEAAFQYDGVLVIADIIVKSRNKWKIYEVKSSTSIADYQINDTSIQYYVITKCGIDIEDISVIYINNKYVKQGEIDVKQLFTIESVKDRVIGTQDFVMNKIGEFKKILAEKSVPNIDIGQQCSDPFPCDFKKYCWKHIPEYSVFNLSRIGKKAFELYKNGVTEIKDISDGYKLSSNQLLEKKCYDKNEDFIDYKEIKKFISIIKYPLYFMDFESIQFAIPIFDNSRPYQQIVFQYSIYYKETKNSEPIHYEYLGDAKSDPRPEFLKNLLLDTKKQGLILVYNAAFEKTRLNELANDFSEYEMQIDDLNNRIVDLMIPFQNRLFYKPEMKSRHSLKNVLPALNPKYNYDKLEIKEGGKASSEYLRMRNITNENEIHKIRKNLLEYCGLDTYGMIIILDELERISK